MLYKVKMTRHRYTGNRKFNQFTYFFNNILNKSNRNGILNTNILQKHDNLDPCRVLVHSKKL
jgi:hypothetical protein